MIRMAGQARCTCANNFAAFSSSRPVVLANFAGPIKKFNASFVLLYVLYIDHEGLTGEGISSSSFRVYVPCGNLLLNQTYSFQSKLASYAGLLTESFDAHM